MAYKSEVAKWSEYFTYFNRDAKVEYKKRTYKASEKDFQELNIRGNYWHSKKDPSSWLTASTVRHFKIKYSEKLPRSKIIELVAQILNVDVAKIENTLDWNANYTSWHDGAKAEDYHVYPKES